MRWGADMRIGWAAGAAAVLAFTLAGCEPARDTTTQSVAFRTVPEGATIAVKGAGTCSTPCALTMSSGESHVAEVSREGCYPTRAIVAPVADETRMLTLVGALFGTGYQLKPDPTSLKLVCGK